MQILVFLCTASLAHGYNILCLFPYPGKSHHMVFEPILEELSRRGHHLTVVSFFPPESSIAGRRDVSLAGLAPISVEVVNLTAIDVKRFFGFKKALADFSLMTALAESNLRLCRTLLYSEQMKEFADGKGSYDVILMEYFNSDCMLALVPKYGAPVVGVMSSAALPWTAERLGAPDNPAYVPGMTLPFTDDMSFLERVKNAVTLYLYKWWFEVFIRRAEQLMAEARFGVLPSLSDVARNTSAVLVNTHHTVSGPRVMPPAFIEVGGIHLFNRTVQPLPKDLEYWVSGATEGFILVSFGSLIRGSTLPAQRLRALLTVFAELPQRVVWKWETENLDNLPANVRLFKWLPQYDLLKHNACVAFVSHAGLLSVTETVAAGVPALSLPVLGDQLGNAAHLRAAAGAPLLRFTDLDEVTFRAAIKQVLSPENRASASLLSQKFTDRPLSPMDTAIFYVERAARYGGLRLSSHARWLSVLQYTMLDAAAVLLGSLLLTFMLIKWYCRQCSKLRRKEKLC